MPEIDAVGCNGCLRQRSVTEDEKILKKKIMRTPQSEILIYQNPDGNIKIDVRLEEENVWLTQKLTCLRQKGRQVEELFQVKPQNITMHLKNIFKECELEENSVCRDFRHTAKHKTCIRNIDKLKKGLIA